MFNSINMLLVNSKKGEEILRQIPNVVLKRRTLEEAIKGNDTLRQPTLKPELYAELFQLCENVKRNKLRY